MICYRATEWCIEGCLGQGAQRVKVANLSLLSDISKTILCPSGAFKLRFDAFAAEMYRANLGDKAEAEAELARFFWLDQSMRSTS
jgi:hypothetical protein